MPSGTAGYESLEHEVSSHSLLEQVSPSGAIDTECFPDSIYGAGMCFIVQSSVTRSRPVHGLSFLIALAMFANILLQVFAIWSVRVYITYPVVKATRTLYGEFETVAFVDGIFSQDAFDEWEQEKKDKLCQLPLSQPAFTMTILFIWTMTLVIETKQTVLFSVWWLQLPPCDDKPMHIGRAEEDGSVVVQSSSCGMKAIVLTSILLPKFLIGLFLWWLGARWLVATTDLEGLVLNAVALSFIVELDEMTFSALVPHRAKRTLEKFMITVPLAQGNSNKKVLKWILQMGGTFLVLCVVPPLYLTYFQHVLPGYRFDVSGPCNVHMLQN